jgi:hypothetical protein
MIIPCSPACLFPGILLIYHILFKNRKKKQDRQDLKRVPAEGSKRIRSDNKIFHSKLHALTGHQLNMKIASPNTERLGPNVIFVILKWLQMFFKIA